MVVSSLTDPETAAGIGVVAWWVVVRAFSDLQEAAFLTLPHMRAEKGAF